MIPRELSRHTVEDVVSAVIRRSVFVWATHRKDVSRFTLWYFLAPLAQLVQVHVVIAFLDPVVFFDQIVVSFLKANRLEFVGLLSRWTTSHCGWDYQQQNDWRSDNNESKSLRNDTKEKNDYCLPSNFIRRIYVRDYQGWPVWGTSWGVPSS